MPEADNIQIGADFTEAIRNFVELERVVRASGRTFTSFGKVASVIRTVWKEIDGVEQAVETIKTVGEAFDELGNKAQISMSGKVGEGIDEVNVKVIKGRKAWNELQKEIEGALKTAAQVAKQNLGEKLSPNVPFRETLIPRTVLSEAPELAKTKLLKSFSDVLEVQNRVKLSTQELNQVLTAFFGNKSTAFIGGQQDFYEALLRNRKLVQTVKGELTDLGKNVKFNDRFEKVVTPRLPKVDIATGSQKERKAAERASLDLQNFVTDHTEITTRELSNIFKGIAANDPLAGAKKEFIELFEVAKFAYEGIGVAARKSAAEQEAASARLRVKDANTALRQINIFDQQILDQQRKAKELVSSLVKTPTQLPSVGVSDTLFKKHEAATISFKKTLESVQPTAERIQTVLNQINKNDGPGELAGKNLRLYDSLKKILDIQTAIEIQSGKSREALIAEVNADFQKSIDATKKLADQEKQSKRVAQARTFAKTQLATGKTITPETEQFQPRLTESFRNQVLKLDTTIIETGASIKTIKAAMTAFDATNLSRLPKKVRIVRQVLIDTKLAQDQLTAATQRSIVADGKSAEAIEAKARRHELAQAKLKTLQSAVEKAPIIKELAKQDLIKPVSEDVKFVDPKILEVANQKIGQSLGKILAQIDGAKIGFLEFHEAMAASTDPTAIEQLAAPTKRLALEIQTLTKRQQNLNAIIDSTIAKRRQESQVELAKSAALIPLNRNIPTIGVDPRLFDTLRAKTNSYIKLLDTLKPTVQEVDAAIAGVGKAAGTFDTSRVISLRTALESIQKVERDIGVSQGQLTAITEQETNDRIASAQKELSAITEVEKIRARVQSVRQNKLPLTREDVIASPNSVEKVQKGFLALDLAIQKVARSEKSLTFEEFERISRAVTKGDFDLSKFEPDRIPIRNALVDISHGYQEIANAKDKASKKLEAIAQKNKLVADKEVANILKTVDQTIAAQQKLGQTTAAKQAGQKHVLEEVFAAVPKVPTVDLPTENVEAQIRKINNLIAGVTDQIDGVKIGFEGVQRAIGGAFNPEKIRELSLEERRLAGDIKKALDAQLALNSAASKATTIKADRQVNTVRVTEGQTAISDAVKGVPTSGAKKDVNRLTAAQRTLNQAFRDSNIPVAKLKELLVNAASGNRLEDIEDEFKTVYNACVRLDDAVQNLGGQLNKAGQSNIRGLTKDLRKEFAQAKIDIDQFKNVLSSALAGTPVPPNLDALKTKVRELFNEQVKFGDATKTLAQNQVAASNAIIQAIQAEVVEIKERNRAEIEAEIERTRKRNEKRARLEKEAKQKSAEGTAARQLIFPDIEAAFGKLPKFAGQDDIPKINAGFAAITNQAVKAKIPIADVLKEIQNVKAQLAQPIRSQIFAPLSPEMEKLRTNIIATENAFRGVESPATKAGKGILISWQGVFRLFQAQVLHTALSQIIADFRQAITEVGNFQREVALIQTITQDAANAGTTFEGWSQSIIKLSNALGKTPTEVATAAYDALSNQITTTKEDTEAFVKTAGEFARTTGSTTPDAVNLLSSAIVSYGLSASDAESVSAKFFATIDLGRVKASDLANSLGRVTSLGSALGVSLDELNAGLVVLTQQGVKAPDALTQLNAVFQKLLKPTEATKELFKELNVVSGEGLIASQGFGGALATIAKAAEEGKGDFSEFFNELRSARGGFTLAKNGAEQFNKALRDLSEAESKFEGAKGFVPAAPGVELQRQIAQLSNTITEEFGGKMAAAIINVTHSLGSLTTIFRTAFNAVIDAVKLATVTLIAFKSAEALAFGTSAIASLIAYRNAGNGIAATFTLLTSRAAIAAAAVNAAFFLTPVGAFVGAVTAAGLALGAMAVWASRAREAQIDAFRESETAAIEHANNLKGLTAQRISQETADLKKGLEEQSRMFAKHDSEVRKHYQDLFDGLKSISEGIKNALDISVTGIVDDFKEGLGSVTKTIDQAQKNRQDIKDFVKDIPGQEARVDFENKLAAAPPERKESLILQRIAQLQAEGGVKLFETGNIQDALKAFDEANKLALNNTKIYAQLSQVLNKRDRNQQVSDIVKQSKPVDIGRLNPQYLKLAEAQRQLNILEGQHGTSVEEHNKLLDQRATQLNRINQIQASIGRIVQPKETGLNKDFVTKSLQARDLAAQTAASGGNYAQAMAGVRQSIAAELPLLKAADTAQAEFLAKTKAQEDTFKANIRTVESLKKELFEISGKFFKQDGTLISPDEIEANFEQIDRLKKLIEATFLKQYELQLAIAPETVDPKQVQDKVDQFEKQFGDFVFNIQGQINQQKNLAGLETGAKKRQALEERIADAIERQGVALQKALDLSTELTKTTSEMAKQVGVNVEDIFAPGIWRALGIGKGIAPTDANGAFNREREAIAQTEILAINKQIQEITSKPIRTVEDNKRVVELLNIELDLVRAINEARDDLAVSKAPVDLVKDGKASTLPFDTTLLQQRQQFQELVRAQESEKSITKGREIGTQIQAGLATLDQYIPAANIAKAETEELFIKFTLLSGEVIRVDKDLQSAVQALRDFQAQSNKGLPPKLQTDIIDLNKERKIFQQNLDVNPQLLKGQQTIEELRQKPNVPITTPVTDPIKASFNELEPIGAQVFEPFEEKALASIDRVKGALDGLSQGAFGLRTALAVTAVGAAPTEPQNVLPLQLNKDELLTAYDQFRTQIQPINVIDELNSIGAINRIQNQLSVTQVPPPGPSLQPANQELQTTNNLLGQISNGWNIFVSSGTNAAQNIANVINGTLIPAIQNAQRALANLQTSIPNSTPGSAPVQKRNMGGSVGYHAEGGVTNYHNVMLTKDELLFPPAMTKKYYSQLVSMNTSMKPRGTDTIPAYLPTGTFVLNQQASRKHFPEGKINEQYLKNYNSKEQYFSHGGVIGAHSLQYLQTGGMTLNPTFIPQLSTRNRTFNRTTSSNDSSITMGNLSINVQGSSNISTEQQALQLGKALQRQIRIGRLKG